MGEGDTMEKATRGGWRFWLARRMALVGIWLAQRGIVLSTEGHWDSRRRPHLYYVVRSGVLLARPVEGASFHSYPVWSYDQRAALHKGIAVVERLHPPRAGFAYSWHTIMSM